MASEADWRRSVLPFTLRHEGGLSLDRRDPGNWTGGKVGLGRLVGTKYGIAASAHPMLDIRSLTLDDAAAIYWRDYVVRPGFDALPLPLLLVVFDTGVNCGTGRAKRWLAATPAGAPIEARVRAVSAASLAFHRRLKTWSTFGKGWSTRIADEQRQALLLLAAAPTALPASHPAPQIEHARSAPRAADQAPAGWLAHALCWLVDSLLPQPALLRT